MNNPYDDRSRPQVDPHIRALQVQILDALLRIEELLQPRSVARGNYEERVTPETLNEVIPEAPAAPKKGGRFGRK